MRLRSMGILVICALAGGSLADDPLGKTPIETQDSYGDPLPDRAIARCGMIRMGDRHPWRLMALSPDGKYEAYRLWEGGIAVCDTQSGRREMRFDDAVAPVAFSPDGRLLLAMAPEYKSAIWQLSSAEQTCMLPTSGRAASFSHDSSLVVAAFGDGLTLGVFDASSGRQLRTLKSPGRIPPEVDDNTAFLVAVGFDRQNGIFAAEIDDWDQALRILHWEPDSAQLFQATRWMPIRDIHASVRLCADCSAIAIATEGEVSVHATRDLSTIRKMDRVASWRSPAALSADGAYVAFSDSVETSDGFWYGIRV